MVFSSNIFLFAFFPLIFACYFALPQKFVKAKNILLLVASLFFYAWGEFVYLWLLLFSILGNYFFGIWICGGDKVDEIRGDDVSVKPVARAFLARSTKFSLALIFNLALLLYFKYAGFIAQNFSAIFGGEVNRSLLPNHLPIGISFFTFHAISYLVDIYRHKSRAQRSFFALALYISFFPQLVAGPIVRYNFIEKYLTRRRQNWFLISYGARRFIIGLGKKVIIANPLGEVADAIFATQITDITTPIAWLGILCYTLQIYFDFSGYSDMAVGLARIFGLKFPENFNYPYISKSIKEFWRRWHISLSAWFRDYVYIPLGGNRVSISRQYFNLVLVFFLCGLWHGASWNFVVWGLFHGLFLVFERVDFVEKTLQKLPSFIQHFYAIFVVMIGWVFFRSADLTSATSYLKLMFSFSSDEKIVIASNILQLTNSHFVLTALGFAFIGFSPIVKNISLKLMRKNKIFIAIFDGFLLLTFIFAIIRLSASTYNPFIYFQF